MKVYQEVPMYASACVRMHTAAKNMNRASMLDLTTQAIDSQSEKIKKMTP